MKFQKPELPIIPKPSMKRVLLRVGFDLNLLSAPQLDIFITVLSTLNKYLRYIHFNNYRKAILLKDSKRGKDDVDHSEGISIEVYEDGGIFFRYGTIGDQADFGSFKYVESELLGRKLQKILSSLK